MWSVIFLGLATLTGWCVAQDCLCFTSSNVNIRDAACGNVIGSGSTGQCYTDGGTQEVCDLNGVTYTYLQFDYNGAAGWVASDFLDAGNCPIDVEPGDCDAISQVSRAGWGARDPSGTLSPLNTPVDIVFIHHTVTAPCNTEASCIQEMKNIQNFHMDGNGWTDIGYNFLVGGDDQAYEGRGWEYVGAHTGGACNPRSVAISLIGNFHPPEGGTTPSTSMMDAVRHTIDCAVREGIVSPWGQFQLHGHRDESATACPGDAVYSEISTWPWYGGSNAPC